MGENRGRDGSGEGEWGRGTRRERRKWERQRKREGKRFEDGLGYQGTRRVSVRRACMYLLVAGALVLVSPWLSVVYSGGEHARAPTQLCRAYNKGSAPPLAKGCAGVARFYLWHSSAKGVRDEIYLRGFCVFFGAAYAHTYVRLCLRVHSRTRAHRAQWRFSVVPRPFKQGNLETYPRPRTLPRTTRQRWRVKP